MEYIYLPPSILDALKERHPDLRSLEMEAILNEFSDNDLRHISYECTRLLKSLPNNLGYLKVSKCLPNINLEDGTPLFRDSRSLNVCTTKDYKLIVYTCETPNAILSEKILTELADVMSAEDFIKSEPFVNRN